MTKAYMYKVADTTKIQREKYVNGAICISMLSKPEPSTKAKHLMRSYIDWKCELTDAKKQSLNITGKHKTSDLYYGL